MICDECQAFPGHHVHHAPNHSSVCVCDGADKHRVLISDAAVQFAVRLADATDTATEQDGLTPGVYSGRDTTVWPAILKRLGAIWKN